MDALTLTRCFDIALWLAGGGHFLLTLAGSQVPIRLHWRTDLASLHPFNRKLMWVYGGFTMFTVVAFGVLTLVLHQELLRGDRTALGLAAFIGVYWTARLVVDFTYYDHRDWPPGRAFTVGHILLTTLIASLAATYVGLVVWHIWFRTS